MMTFNLKSKGLKGINQLLLVAYFFFFLLLVNKVFQINFATITIFFAFQLWGIIVPGLCISILYKGSISWTTRIFLSYALGYAFNIFEYFIVELLNRNISHTTLSLFFSIMAVVIIFYKNKTYKELFNFERTTKLELFVIFTTISLLFINLLCFSCLHKDILNLIHDQSWWLNNSVALKIKYPPSNPFMSGTDLFYHYFSSIQIAYTSLTTGIDIASLSIPFYSWTKTILMFGSVIFFLEVMDINNVWTKIFGVILILFTTGIETASLVTYFHHIFMMPFGFDVGFAFGLFFVSFLLHQFKYTEFDYKILLLTLVSWSICVGAKAPIAAVLLLFPALLCLDWLITRKYKLAFSYGLTLLGVFFLISIECVGMLSVTNGNSSSYYLQLHNIEELRIFAGEKRNIFLAVIARWIAISPTIFFMILLAIFDYFSYRKITHKKIDIVIIASFLTYMWGNALWIVISADGNSEMYYAMSAFIPAYILILKSYHHIEKINFANNNRKIVENTGRIIFIFIGVYIFLFNPYGGKGLFEYTKDTIKNIHSISLLDSHSLDGLRWIRDNTEKSTIIVSDKAVISNNDRFYIYGIVSERQQYIEGSHMLRFGSKEIQSEIQKRKELVKQLYKNTNETIQKLKLEGVDYVVQTIEITPYFKPNDTLLELVFSSKEMNVYRIR